MTRTVYRHSRAVPRHSRGSGNPLRLAFIFAVISLAASPASGQVVTGVPPFGSFSGGPDIVNNANLNVHIQIPVVNKAGRGIPFSYTITFDSSVWYPSGGVWLPVASWGWGNATQQGGTGYVVDKWTQGSCRTGPRNPLQYYDIYSQWRYYDAFGAIHPFSLTLSDASIETTCTGQPPYSGTATTSDGTGYKLSADAGGDATIYARSGLILSPPFAGPGASSMTDTNGNLLDGTTTSFTDTLNTTAVSIAGSGTPSSPTTFTYTAASGNQATVTMNYTPYTVQTDFGCSGITEYGATSQNLVSSIALPDTTTYTITYEVTPGDSHNPHYVTGRIASLQLPTGGTISYAYSGGSNGITCADGSTAALARTTPDGTWTYAQTQNGGASTTTLTDPQSNVTTYN